MIVRKTFKYRLYHNRRNKKLNQRIDCAGIAWNHIIALQRHYYKLTGKYINKYEMMKHMAKLRRQGRRFEYLKMLGSSALQNICKRQDNAYQAFFKYKRAGGIKRGYPTFKKVKKYKSFTLTQSGWKYRDGNKITIQGYNYKFSLSRPVEGSIKTVTIKRDNLGRFWVIFSVIQEIPDPVIISTGNIGGFDFGLKTFLTDSEGNVYKSPQFFKAELNNIARLNRGLSRKVKGSNNWRKTKHQLAKAHYRIANKRANYHWKLAHELASKFDYLFFEDLNMQAMKKLWGRKISDLGFALFLPIQKQVCQKTGKSFAQIGKWQPTTKPCARCSAIHNLGLNDRTFQCNSCGWVLDRDHNAAINICAEGASSAGLGDVRQIFISAITARSQESLLL